MDKSLSHTIKEIGIDKSKLIDKLLFNHFQYERIIKYFGNPNSRVFILGESPVFNHLKSESNSIFALDDETFNQKGHSGEVILKVFKDLELNYKD